MRAYPPGRWLVAAMVLLILLPATSAEAVIPSAFGPLQALIAILPQLLMALAAGMVALFKPKTYRFLFAYLRAHKGLTLALLGMVALLVWGPAQFFRGPVAHEQVGSPWAAFRGGPRRIGTVPGALGPVRPPRIAWKYAGEALGGSAAIDSSPAVVGNRVYFGVSTQSVFSSAGAIHCVDAETGGTVWKYTGEGELDPPLRPVFSSPAVWAEPTDGDAPKARFVVSGEGYHEDRDCRILCLDLAGENGPKLNWVVQTTSHVESSPCIHDGKVYVGAGDDGVWCVDLRTGRTLWRLEGGPFYEIAAGPEVERLEELVGRQAALTGSARRVFDENSEDPGSGTQILDVKSFKEHSGPAAVAPGTDAPGERIVIGRVVRVDAARPEGVSPLRIEVVSFFPDAESSPVGTAFPGTAGGAILFGTGIQGQALNCVDARTGELIWKTPVPFPAFGAPTVAGEHVLTGVGNGNFIRSDPNPAGAILCLALRDGRKSWEVPTGDTILGAIAVREDRAYACSRDGKVTVVDTTAGRVVHQFATGTPSVCSPAVTADSIYVTTEAGKLFCLDRRNARARWSLPLAPGQPIISSPAVAGGNVYVGTRSKGLFCLAPPDLDTGPPPIRPWTGPGGDAGRTGTADDAGPPAIAEELGKARWKIGDARGPVIACGDRIYAAIGKGVARIDVATGTLEETFELPGPAVALTATKHALSAIASGKNGFRLLRFPGSENADVSGPVLTRVSDRIIASPRPGTLGSIGEGAPWTVELGEIAGSPASAHGLLFVSARDGRLVCLDDLTGKMIWSVPLDRPPTGPPTISGENVFVAAGTRVYGLRLVDGTAVWQKDLDAAVTSHLAAAGRYLAFATAGEQMFVLKAGDGEELEVLPVGLHGVAPALFEDTLVFAAENRLGTYDLSTSEWQWRYADEDHIGRVLAPPIIVKEMVVAVTEKHGLVAIGVRDTVSRK